MGMFWTLAVAGLCLASLCLSADLNDSELILDKLRRDWRREELKRKSLSSEIQLIDDQILIETELYENLFKLKEAMGVFGVTKSEYLKEDNYFSFKEEKFYDELKLTAVEAKNRFKTKKDELLRAEMEMERLWTDWKFRVAFDYLLDKTVLTPQPKFPEINREILEKAIKFKNSLLEMSSSRAHHMEKYLLDLNDQILKINGVLKSLDFLAGLREQAYKLKRHVEGMTSDNSNASSSSSLSTNSLLTPASSSAILRTLDHFERNQREEMEIYVQDGWNRMVWKFKKLMDNLVNDPNGKWTIRLGQGAFKSNKIIVKEDNNSKNSNSKNSKNEYPVDALLPEHIIRRSEHTENNLKLLNSCKSALSANELKRQGKFKEFYLTNGNEFMIAKYSQFLEEIHKYLVRRGETVPITVYEETLETLLGSE